MTMSIERNNNMFTPSKIVPLNHEKKISDECKEKDLITSCIPSSFNDGSSKTGNKTNDNNNEDNASKTRKVSFSSRPATIISYVESRKNLCKKERERRWLSSEEFTKVKSQCRQEVLRLKNSNNGADIFSYRGMEMIDPEAVVKRQRRYTNSISAVLIEQREQRSKLISTNPKAIKKAYKKVITDSIREALENAYVDTKAVKDYLSTTEEEILLQQEERTKQQQKEQSNKSNKNLVSSMFQSSKRVQQQVSSSIRSIMNESSSSSTVSGSTDDLLVEKNLLDTSRTSSSSLSGSFSNLRLEG